MREVKCVFSLSRILFLSLSLPLTLSDRQQWQVGSLSLMLGASANGYVQLVDFPEEAPDPAVRDVEVGVHGHVKFSSSFLTVDNCLVQAKPSQVNPVTLERVCLSFSVISLRYMCICA